ncbi:MAG: phytanoyl-CoA dioxygenase family protein [Candidatus Methylacidiphilales bacterium]|nr:phytanoyl-CoA dioxygenase family protein [Candidatus Methylacidiphilales bacterium]
MMNSSTIELLQDSKSWLAEAPAYEITPDMVKQYNEQGYLILRGMVPPEVAGQLHADVMHIMNIIGLGRTKLRQTMEYRKDSALAAYIHSARLRDAVAALVGSAHLYLPFTAVKSADGGGQFHFHQDGNYTPIVRGRGINMWMALVPMRDENGGLRVVPGSHAGGRVRAENAGDGDSHLKVSDYPTQSVLMEMEPGDVVAFDRWTIHGSGANRTGGHRLAYAVQFHTTDAVALVNGEEQVLVEKPRWTDIWGVDEIASRNAGSRDGH